jgi:hypothetical protein
VAATMWAVDSVSGLISLGGGLGAGGGSDQRKTGYDTRRSPFLRRTGWASHFLGPPLCFCHSNSTVEHLCTRPHPFRKGRGRCGCRHPGLLMVEPTSLNGGEGLVSGWLQVVAGELEW